MGEASRVGPTYPLYASLGVPRGGVSVKTLASSFDSWFQRCSSLARVPLFSRVLRPSYD